MLKVLVSVDSFQLQQLLLCVRVCVGVRVELTGFILIVVNVDVVGLHDHKAFAHQSGRSGTEIHKVTVWHLTHRVGSQQVSK